MKTQVNKKEIKIAKIKVFLTKEEVRTKNSKESRDLYWSTVIETPEQIKSFRSKNKKLLFKRIGEEI